MRGRRQERKPDEVRRQTEQIAHNNSTCAPLPSVAPLPSFPMGREVSWGFRDSFGKQPGVWWEGVGGVNPGIDGSETSGNGSHGEETWWVEEVTAGGKRL